MASPTTPVGGTAANAAVARLVVEIQAGSDELVDGIVARIRDELPDFRRLPASTLARAVRGNAGRWLRWPSCARRQQPSWRARPRWDASAASRV